MIYKVVKVSCRYVKLDKRTNVQTESEYIRLQIVFVNASE